MYDVTGILLCAKTKLAKTHLATLFAEKTSAVVDKRLAMKFSIVNYQKHNFGPQVQHFFRFWSQKDSLCNFSLYVDVL